jgi:UDP-N-acetylmuramate-alanine ligase
MHIPTKNKPLIIGVFGSNGKTSTISLLYNLLNDVGLGIEVINDKNLSSHIKNMANIEVFKQLKNSSNNDIIIVEINESILKGPFVKEIFFDLLIHCHISEDSYENTVEGLDKINFIANAGKRAKTLILNTDDIRWKDIIVDLENTYLITYGLVIKLR